MSNPLLILLPGMDGTGDLFERLLHDVTSSHERLVLTYSSDQSESYDELLQRLEQTIPVDRDVVLIAESFSGPLAVRFAAAHPDRVKALVLCATFIASPIPRWMLRLAKAPLFRFSPPSIVLRWLLLNGSHSCSIDKVQEAIARVSPSVLANRVRQLAEVDCTHALASCTMPVLYLQATRDRLVWRHCGDAILKSRPDTDVVKIEGPHLLLQACPGECWQVINRFLIDKGVFSRP